MQVPRLDRMSLMKHLAENFQLYPEVQGGVPVGKFTSARWRIDWTGLQDWIDSRNIQNGTTMTLES